MPRANFVYRRRAGLLLITLAVMVAVVVTAGPSRAQDVPAPDGPPFSWPFAGSPGPATWFYEQHYGNTIPAYNFGDIWYPAGQGLHFGFDLMAPCETPVLAIADGVVRFISAPGFGAGPHSVVLDHPGTGYSSLYGHLKEYPSLTQGQAVVRGEQIGISGDPDGSCGSRPHLHLEIRSEDFMTAYNPEPFFDVNWHMLASIGPEPNAFQQDIDAPYRWMALETQPAISFSANILNRYTRPWPPKLEESASGSAAPARQLDPLPDDVRVTRELVSPDWSIGAWWDPQDPAAVYLVDAVPGQAAGVFRQPFDGAPRQYLYPAPPPQYSPDGSLLVQRQSDGTMLITERASGDAQTASTYRIYPAVSPGNDRMLYELVYGEFVPGTSYPGVDVIVADLDGTNPRSITTLRDGRALWLDDHRVLIARRIDYTAETRLFIIDLDDELPQPQQLGSYTWLHDLRVAPGGAYIAFWQAFTEDATAAGVYVQATRIGSQPRKLPFFGAYRWRDSRRLFNLSFDADDDVHTLNLYDMDTREQRALTNPGDLPLRVANGEWSVAPDGSSIVYVDPTDYALYRLTFGAD